MLSNCVCIGMHAVEEWCWVNGELVRDPLIEPQRVGLKKVPLVAEKNKVECI